MAPRPSPPPAIEGMRSSIRLHRQRRTAAITSRFTRAGGSEVKRKAVPSSVLMLKASWMVHPNRAAVATKLAAGPVTAAHVFDAAANVRFASAVKRIMALRGSNVSHAARAQYKIGSTCAANAGSTALPLSSANTNVKSKSPPATDETMQAAAARR